MESQFEVLVQEDFKQFRDIAKRFSKIDMSDIDGLRELTIDSWLLATRWSEIQSNATKYAQSKNINKTDFSTWAYQKYRQLQEMHITCRSWHRLSKQDEIANNIIDD